MMRVVCPLVPPLPSPVLDALDASGYGWEPCDVSGSDSTYFDLLSGLWASGDDWIICEHDVVPTPGALAGLAVCPAPWCAQAVPYLANVVFGLGLAGFTAAFCADHPDAMATVGTMSDLWHPPHHWCRLDGWLTNVLNEQGAFVHAHPDPVGHLNTTPSHGCRT